MSKKDNLLDANFPDYEEGIVAGELHKRDRADASRTAILRLLNQQLAAPQFADPAEVVGLFGAMQAQEYRMMRWAVAMRTSRPSHKAFQEAFNSGRIIRLHLMRGTWQLVTADDYWDFLNLCAPKTIAVTNGWMRNNITDIPDEEVRRVRDLLAQTAADKGSATKEDFVQALADKDMPWDDHRLSYHIRMAEITGLLCSGDLQPMKVTYALAADKVKRNNPLDRDEALLRFTRKYFQSHQPATLEDFVWWSGLNVGDCRRGIALLGDYLHIEPLSAGPQQRRDFYMTADCRTRGFRKGRYLLIPPYDEYLIGYKSREVALPPEHRHKAHDNKGTFRPVVAHDGLICGNWSPFQEECEATFFEGDGDAGKLQAAWQRYVQYL